MLAKLHHDPPSSGGSSGLTITPHVTCHPTCNKLSTCTPENVSILKPYLKLWVNTKQLMRIRIIYQTPFSLLPRMFSCLSQDVSYILTSWIQLCSSRGSNCLIATGSPRHRAFHTSPYRPFPTSSINWACFDIVLWRWFKLGLLQFGDMLQRQIPITHSGRFNIKALVRIICRDFRTNER